MNKRLLSFLLPQTIEVVQSKFNGEIKVKMFAGRYSLEAGGLMQSGKFLEDTWEKALRKLPIYNSQLPISKILILGLGGGSIVNVFKKYFPKAKITGVDIDRKMIELGKGYLELNEVSNLKIIIVDANDFIKKNRAKNKKYDLIFVDLYKGKEIPKKFQTQSFIRNLDQILSKNSTAIFNFLKIQMKKNEAVIFLDKLKNFFHAVDTVSVYANTLIFISRKT